MRTPRAEIKTDEITEPLVNTGDQSGWCKNPDNCTQGPRLETTACGWDCPRGPGCDLCLTRAMMLISKRDGFDMGKVRPLPESLYQPARWKNRKNVHASPTGDLFHDNIPEGYIRDVFCMFGYENRHNYLLTTKREHNLHLISEFQDLRNVYVGVSIESQQFMDRANALLDLPNNFYKILVLAPMITDMVLPRKVLRGVDQVICTPERGGQGRHPRPCPEKWLLDLVKQIKSFDSGLPLFLDMPYQEDRIHRFGGNKYTEMHSSLFE